MGKTLDIMAFKLKGFPYGGKSPLTQKKEDDVNKLQEGEHPDTWVFKGDKGRSEDANIQEKIIDLEDRISFAKEDGETETANKLTKQLNKMKSLKSFNPGSV